MKLKMKNASSFKTSGFVFQTELILILSHYIYIALQGFLLTE